MRGVTPGFGVIFGFVQGQSVFVQETPISVLRLTFSAQAGTQLRARL